MISLSWKPSSSYSVVVIIRTYVKMISVPWTGSRIPICRCFRRTDKIFMSPDKCEAEDWFCVYVRACVGCLVYVVGFLLEYFHMPPLHWFCGKVYIHNLKDSRMVLSTARRLPDFNTLLKFNRIRDHSTLVHFFSCPTSWYHMSSFTL